MGMMSNACCALLVVVELIKIDLYADYFVGTFLHMETNV